MSLRESILAAFQTKLASLAEGRVYRSRKEQVPTLPVIFIEPSRATCIEQPLGMLEHDLVVYVVILAKGETPDSAADATLADAHAAIMADITLGLGADVQVMQQVETDWNFEDYDHAQIILGFHVNYRTAIGAF